MHHPVRFSAWGGWVERAHSPFTGTWTGIVAGSVAAVVAAGLLVAGCGAGATTAEKNPGGPVPGESTTVTVVATSTANDQLTKFLLQLQSLTLTNKAGTSVPLLSTPQQVEFMHLNGGAEPLLTVSVPQDVYTTATATVGSASFLCATQLADGSDGTDTYAYGTTPPNQVTVQLPSPVTVSGAAMALSLNLLVSQSASFPASCFGQGNTTPQYAITPTFTLAPWNGANGRMTGLAGMVSAVDGDSFTVAAADSFTVLANPVSAEPASNATRTWPVSTGANTVFQGVGNAAGVTPGMAVDLDGALQPDGSVAATRLAVVDPDTTTVTVNSGPVMQVATAEPVLLQVNQVAEGSQIFVLGWPQYDFSNAAFGIWGGLTNVAGLPFAASFSGANLVDGQMVAITTHVSSIPWAPAVTPSTTVTLVPQTIDGTVQAVGTAGAFTTYTVQVAPYSFFPVFAVQAGQTTVLTNPRTVVVYADGNTQMLTTGAGAGMGETLRFTGVIFNDNGTLRMDCTQVMNGVTE